MIDYLRIQHDMVMALKSTNKLHESLEIILEHALQLEVIDSGAVHFVDSETDELTFITCKGFSQEFQNHLLGLKEPTHVMKQAMTDDPAIRRKSDLIQFELNSSCVSENQGTILFLPIRSKGKTIAIMSVSSHSEEEIPLPVQMVLETIIAHLENIIARTRVEYQLNLMAQMRKQLSEMSTRFIDMDSEKTDDEVKTALKTIGELTGADKTGIFMLSDDHMYANVTHSWSAVENEHDVRCFYDFAVGNNSWWLNELLKGETFCINSVDDIPSEAIIERKLLQETNTKSLLVVPMIYHGRILGNLCLFYSTVINRTDEFLRVLRMMGEVFANALEHKRKDDEIKDTAHKYKTIFEQIHDVYFEIKMDGSILNISPSIKDHIGFEPEELIGTSIIDIFAHPERKLDILQNLELTGGIKDYIVKIKKKDGDDIYVSANAHLIYSSNGNIEKIVGMARDVTKIKMIEKMSVEAKLLLENASNTKNEFLSIINHELRTPLSHVMGFSEVLIDNKGQPLTSQQLKYVQYIRSASKKLFDLLTSLNHIAEIESGKMELEITEFSLSPLLSEIQKITSSMASKKNINIIFNTSIPFDNIIGDRSKIKTILINLISNAIKFTPDGGEVVVDVEQDDKRDLHFIVKDAGIGISEENMKVLFKPFIQLEKTLDRKHEGAGLGLALVKEFIDILRGDISVYSQVGMGSTFKFTIPGNEFDGNRNINCVSKSIKQANC